MARQLGYFHSRRIVAQVTHHNSVVLIDNVTVLLGIAFVRLFAQVFEVFFNDFNITPIDGLGPFG